MFSIRLLFDMVFQVSFKPRYLASPFSCAYCVGNRSFKLVQNWSWRRMKTTLSLLSSLVSPLFFFFLILVLDIKKILLITAQRTGDAINAINLD